MVSKEQFVDAINSIKEEYEWFSNLDNVFGCVIEAPRAADKIIDLLEESLGLDSNDIYGSDISYFIYELDFGKDWKPGCITIDDKDIDISTAEKLYDYLTTTNN